MSNTTTQENAPAITKPKQKIVAGQFGQTQTSAAMKSWYGDMVRWGLNEQLAHLVAVDCAVHFATAFNASKGLSAEVQKVKADLSGFKISGKTAGVTMHDSMAIVRAVQLQEKLRESMRKEALYAAGPNDAGKGRNDLWIACLSEDLTGYLATVQYRAQNRVEWVSEIPAAEESEA